DGQQVKKELSYWLEVVGGPMAHLPVEQTGGANTVESGRSIEVKLGEAETQALLQEAPRVYRAQVNEVLVTALGQALVEWCGVERVVIDLEGHGREEIGRGVDVSRTVGWFTTIYPVALKIELGSDVIEALKSVKDQLRVGPERGLGYGLLMYLSREVSASARGKLASPAEVSFNYLGQFDQTLNESAAFKLSPESSGQTSGSAGLRHYLLKINGAIINRCLRLTFTYSKNMHRHETIGALAEKYLKILRAFITSCQKGDEHAYTPSDFPQAGLSQKDLGNLIAKIDQLSRRSSK